LLADAGAGIDTFHLVETGEIEIVGRDGAATPGPGSFAGDTSFLGGRRYLASTRAVRDSRILAVPRQGKV
jgi:CRP-like cAMP-binding protein